MGKTKSYTDEQIFEILKDLENGHTLTYTAKRHGISNTSTIGRWAKKAGVDYVRENPVNKGRNWASIKKKLEKSKV